MARSTLNRRDRGRAASMKLQAKMAEGHWTPLAARQAGCPVAHVPPCTTETCTPSGYRRWPTGRRVADRCTVPNRPEHRLHPLPERLRRCSWRTSVDLRPPAAGANGGAKLAHGSGGMVLPRRSKTLPVCQPFPVVGRAGGFTREPASREADGAVSQGPSGVPGRDERARGGAPFRDLAREREEDARVLRSAGVPAHGAGAPSEARRIYRIHRRVAAGGSQGRASQAAAHREAHLRSSSRRARVHRRVHDREGPCSRASSSASGDVRAAGSSAGARAGRFRRSVGVHRRGQAEGPFLRLRPAAQRRIVRSSIPCGDGRGMGRRARARVLVLRHGPVVDSLRQRPVPGVADRA